MPCVILNIILCCPYDIPYIKCGLPKRTFKSPTEIVKKLEDLQNVTMMGTLLYS